MNKISIKRRLMEKPGINCSEIGQGEVFREPLDYWSASKSGGQAHFYFKKISLRLLIELLLTLS
jgi:hypothetical protein